VFDRQLLLSGAKRNEVLALAEVQRYGRDSYGDAEYVSIYGLRPADWYARGVRLLGRTAVECTRDALANAIAQDVAAHVTLRSMGQAGAGTASPTVVVRSVRWLGQHAALAAAPPAGRARGGV
jgi:hypothetical protein